MTVRHYFSAFATVCLMLLGTAPALAELRTYKFVPTEDRPFYVHCGECLTVIQAQIYGTFDLLIEGDNYQITRLDAQLTDVINLIGYEVHPSWIGANLRILLPGDITTTTGVLIDQDGKFFSGPHVVFDDLITPHPSPAHVYTTMLEMNLAADAATLSLFSTSTAALGDGPLTYHINAALAVLVPEPSAFSLAATLFLFFVGYGRRRTTGEI